MAGLEIGAELADMLQAILGSRERPLHTVLCLGAHCDDIEIGAGGTILRLVHERPDVRVHWVVFSSDERRGAEARASAAAFLAGARHPVVTINAFRNGYFPQVWSDIKEYFERLKREVTPDLILTHYRHDLHQDHRVLSDLAWNTFRDHLILEYEIPKYDGDLGTPNCYVALDEATCRRKVEVLMRSFPSQHDKQWFTEDTFFALLRLRGIESNAAGRYAEGFYCRKLVI